MSDELTYTPIDELRKLAASNHLTWRDKRLVNQLYIERADHMLAIDSLMTETRGRAMKADEARTSDRLYESVSLIDKIAAKVRASVDEAANIRAAHAHLFGDADGNTSGAGIGAQLRHAIHEVMNEGRSTAYVDYPTETRALTESGVGGFGVATKMYEPVSALTAKSVIMSIPGINQVTQNEGDRARFPRFNAVSVAGTAEGAALNAAASDLDAVDIVFQKFSTYETMSTELEEDFSADALNLLGERMLKDLAARVDQGLIQGVGAADVLGLFSQPGVSTTSVAALPTDFDKIDEALYQLALNDGEAGAWIMHPRTWRILAQIKTGIASDKTTLLQPSPQAAPKTLRGLPVFTSTGISIVSGATSAGSTAAVIDPSQIVVVTRRKPRLEISRDVAFSTDQVAIRATTRIGLGVIDPAGGVSLLTDIRAS